MALENPFRPPLATFLRPEFEVEFVRASGPGGQKVNKTSSAVLLRWNVARSTAITDDQKSRVFAKLKNRINDQGELVLKVQELRSQHQNRDRAYELAYELIQGALRQDTKRIPTKPSRASVQARLTAKKATSNRKATRRQPRDDEY
ncbi:MAG: alternative ribosome rescue aminoacyl-tRNA hydrolase ArfB [Patescibacteria group bacterium]